MPHPHTENAQGRIKDFVAWAEDQAKVLDRKIDAVKAEAALAGAQASAEAKADWRDIQAALDRQRQDLARQVEGLTDAAETELKDMEAATKKSIRELGKKAEDLKRMIGKARP